MKRGFKLFLSFKCSYVKLYQCYWNNCFYYKIRHALEVNLKNIQSVDVVKFTNLFRINLAIFMFAKQHVFSLCRHFVSKNIATKPKT